MTKVKIISSCPIRLRQAQPDKAFIYKQFLEMPFISLAAKRKKIKIFFPVLTKIFSV